MVYNFSGLTDSEAEKSRLEHGSNELSPQPIESFFDKLIANFKDPIIIILCAALIIIFIL